MAAAVRAPEAQIGIGPDQQVRPNTPAREQYILGRTKNTKGEAFAATHEAVKAKNAEFGFFSAIGFGRRFLETGQVAVDSGKVARVMEKNNLSVATVGLAQAVMSGKNLEAAIQEARAQGTAEERQIRALAESGAPTEQKYASLSTPEAAIDTPLGRQIKGLVERQRQSLTDKFAPRTLNTTELSQELLRLANDPNYVSEKGAEVLRNVKPGELRQIARDLHELAINIKNGNANLANIDLALTNMTSGDKLLQDLANTQNIYAVAKYSRLAAALTVVAAGGVGIALANPFTALPAAGALAITFGISWISKHRENAIRRQIYQRDIARQPNAVAEVRSAKEKKKTKGQKVGEGIGKVFGNMDVENDKYNYTRISADILLHGGDGAKGVDTFIAMASEMQAGDVVAALDLMAGIDKRIDLSLSQNVQMIDYGSGTRNEFIGAWVAKRSELRAAIDTARVRLGLSQQTFENAYDEATTRANDLLLADRQAKDKAFAVRNIISATHNAAVVSALSFAVGGAIHHDDIGGWLTGQHAVGAIPTEGGSTGSHAAEATATTHGTAQSPAETPQAGAATQTPTETTQSTVSTNPALADVNCFVAGTKILMADGSTKPIEQVQIGDMVLSYNEATQQVIAQKVLETVQPTHDEMVTLAFANGAANTNTFDHPYMVAGKGWASYNPTATKDHYDLTVEQLAKDDKVLVYTDGKLEETTLTDITIKKEVTQTYNLSNIENTHTFFANGILVHNKGLHSAVGGPGADQAIKGKVFDATKGSTSTLTDNTGHPAPATSATGEGLPLPQQVDDWAQQQYAAQDQAWANVLPAYQNAAAQASQSFGRDWQHFLGNTGDVLPDVKNMAGDVKDMMFNPGASAVGNVKDAILHDAAGQGLDLTNHAGIPQGIENAQGFASFASAHAPDVATASFNAEIGIAQHGIEWWNDAIQLAKDHNFILWASQHVPGIGVTPEHVSLDNGFQELAYVTQHHVQLPPGYSFSVDDHTGQLVIVDSQAHIIQGVSFEAQMSGSNIADLQIHLPDGSVLDVLKDHGTESWTKAAIENSLNHKYFTDSVYPGLPNPEHAPYLSDSVINVHGHVGIQFSGTGSYGHMANAIYMQNNGHNFIIMMHGNHVNLVPGDTDPRHMVQMIGQDGHPHWVTSDAAARLLGVNSHNLHEWHAGSDGSFAGQHSFAHNVELVKVQHTGVDANGHPLYHLQRFATATGRGHNVGVNTHGQIDVNGHGHNQITLKNLGVGGGEQGYGAETPLGRLGDWIWNAPHNAIEFAEHNPGLVAAFAAGAVLNSAINARNPRGLLGDWGTLRQGRRINNAAAAAAIGLIFVANPGIAGAMALGYVAPILGRIAGHTVAGAVRGVGRGVNSVLGRTPPAPPAAAAAPTGTGPTATTAPTVVAPTGTGAPTTPPGGGPPTVTPTPVVPAPPPPPPTGAPFGFPTAATIPISPNPIPPAVVTAVAPPPGSPPAALTMTTAQATAAMVPINAARATAGLPAVTAPQIQQMTSAVNDAIARTANPANGAYNVQAAAQALVERYNVAGGLPVEFDPRNRVVAEMLAVRMGGNSTPEAMNRRADAVQRAGFAQHAAYVMRQLHPATPIYTGPEYEAAMQQAVDDMNNHLDNGLAAGGGHEGALAMVQAIALRNAFMPGVTPPVGGAVLPLPGPSPERVDARNALNGRYAAASPEVRAIVAVAADPAHRAVHERDVISNPALRMALARYHTEEAFRVAGINLATAPAADVAPIVQALEAHYGRGMYYLGDGANEIRRNIRESLRSPIGGGAGMPLEGRIGVWMELAGADPHDRVRAACQEIGNLHSNLYEVARGLRNMNNAGTLTGIDGDQMRADMEDFAVNTLHLTLAPAEQATLQALLSDRGALHEQMQHGVEALMHIGGGTTDVQRREAIRTLLNELHPTTDEIQQALSLPEYQALTVAERSNISLALYPDLQSRFNAGGISAEDVYAQALAVTGIQPVATGIPLPNTADILDFARILQPTQQVAAGVALGSVERSRILQHALQVDQTQREQLANAAIAGGTDVDRSLQLVLFYGLPDAPTPQNLQPLANAVHGLALVGVRNTPDIINRLATYNINGLTEQALFVGSLADHRVNAAGATVVATPLEAGMSLLPGAPTNENVFDIGRGLDLAGLAPHDLQVAFNARLPLMVPTTRHDIATDMWRIAGVRGLTGQEAIREVLIASSAANVADEQAEVGYAVLQAGADAGELRTITNAIQPAGVVRENIFRSALELRFYGAAMPTKDNIAEAITQALAIAGYPPLIVGPVRNPIDTQIQDFLQHTKHIRLNTTSIYNAAYNAVA